ncbi:PAAR domain-containing protein [Niabella drilacis]|uniref:Zn-binding Pro-Ala-Ala-Arg (PAAR) domain-containing protein, incolved in TypeVI secretion n=1 Tax=Niabella drilacis (strain DSM 25811 / CCM 8410 / CCUG 62505 / LMG 26954 / E90) TaxID=1285928 RepID=A0A1G6Z7Y2_NIADE|nr:PAAR domain-containing protein [Niabella drilacis]SDD98710.1 Zn-binding Pro-Ala-Ala-Arg (PAAR) domain-containing protein, incolved in TypeVI secretion [Niabella drilacis]
MGKPAARVGDMHVCPLVNGLVPHVGGPVLPAGVPNVLIGGQPAAVSGDTCVCTGPPDVIVQGSSGVLIGGRPAARLGDATAHGGIIVLGCFTVLIGEMAGGGSAGKAGGMAGLAGKGTIGAARAKDIINGEALKEAARKGAAVAKKTTKEDFTATFTLNDEAQKAVAGRRYEIRTGDGKTHEGKTNSSGATEPLQGYTTADCAVTFLK